MTARNGASRFLAAVNRLDFGEVANCLHDDAIWRNVPEAPSEGRDSVLHMLLRVLGRCERAQWEVVSECYDKDTAWLERVDRFWINGRELAVHCNGVFRFHPVTEELMEVRDYADLVPWRRTLGEALASL